MTDKMPLEAPYTDQAFLEYFMRYLIEEARWTPKLQLERIVGPLLTPFIARVMTKTLESHCDLKGEYDLISAEFPLLKESPQQKDSSQIEKAKYHSTNIDWLLLNRKTKQLLFLELKTTDEIPRADQMSVYYSWRYDRGAGELLNNYTLICKNSKSKKYEHNLSYVTQSLCKCKDDLTLVYILPAQTKTRLLDRNDSRPDHALSFGDLNVPIDGKHSAAWAIIGKWLEKLDRDGSPSRVLDAACAADTAHE